MNLNYPHITGISVSALFEFEKNSKRALLFIKNISTGRIFVFEEGDQYVLVIRIELDAPALFMILFCGCWAIWSLGISSE